MRHLDGLPTNTDGSTFYSPVLYLSTTTKKEKLTEVFR